MAATIGQVVDVFVFCNASTTTAPTFLSSTNHAPDGRKRAADDPILTHGSYDIDDVRTRCDDFDMRHNANLNHENNRLMHRHSDIEVDELVKHIF